MSSVDVVLGDLGKALRLVGLHCGSSQRPNLNAHHASAAPAAPAAAPPAAAAAADCSIPALDAAETLRAHVCRRDCRRSARRQKHLKKGFPASQPQQLK